MQDTASRMWRSPRRTVLLTVLAINLVVGGAVAYRLSGRAAGTAAGSVTSGAVLGSMQSEAIAQENAHAGGSAWLFAPTNLATTQIQAYASSPSVAPGERLSFFVSVQTPGAQYRVDIYRLGWYGGDGGRLISSLPEVGQAQGYYDPSTKQLVGCVSCRIDIGTHR